MRFNPSKFKKNLNNKIRALIDKLECFLDKVFDFFKDDDVKEVIKMVVIVFGLSILITFSTFSLIKIFKSDMKSNGIIKVERLPLPSCPISLNTNKIYYAH